MTEEQLHGGFIHPGLVVRVGDTVRRPPSKYRDAINALLDHVNGTDLLEVPVPLGLDPEGRETYSYIQGDVPIPPYPAWATTDDALRSIAELLRRYHDAVSSFDVTSHAEWPNDLSDPVGGDCLCHNDVCLENVVFREGRAVGLLDFDFAAPGRAVYDVAMTMRLCGPVGDPRNFGDLPAPVDPLHRLNVFCDAYPMQGQEREELVDALLTAAAVGRDFVRRRAEADEPIFRDMWASGGQERFERNLAWVNENAGSIAGDS